jgi:hypothetical protein
MIPIFLAWTSRGVIEFVALVKQFWPRFDAEDTGLRETVLKGMIVLVLVFFLVPLFLKQFEKADLSKVPLEEKEAGLWIKQHVAPGTIPTVMSSGPTVAFYGGANHIYVPDEDFATVLEYAKRKNVDYLVFGQRRLRNTPRAFPVDGNGTPGLSLVYEDEQNPDFRVLIWKLSQE